MATEIRNLIRNMSQANPLWGAPRIHGELLKLGIEVAQLTVAKYLRRPRKPPSQTWRTFLTNHMEQMASIDFFVVPTATFRILFVLVVLSHARRRVLHFQVTEHPSQEWTMQQIREAFPWDHGCGYLLRDRDAIYGGDWVAMTKDSAKLFCLLPAFENTFGASQGRSRVESSGETRTRARRGDSSGRRTSPSLPAPGCLVIVRRCSAITASKYLALVLRTKADCS